MKNTLGKRLFRYILAISSITGMLSIIAIEWVYEGIESAILDYELTAEQSFYLNQISGPHYQNWHTARLHAFFLPEGQNDLVLPAYLQHKTAPYAGEIIYSQDTYLVLVTHVEEPAGRLYLSQNISTIESNELNAQLSIVGVLLGMLLLGLLLSHLASKRLVKPLGQLTEQIRAIVPGKSMKRLTTHYTDLEFTDIAHAFNLFLDSIEDFIAREKLFIKLAGHEFRTPLAVITGALEIIDKRNTLSKKDQQTVARIRRAIDGMQTDLAILLKLVRGQINSDEIRQLNIHNSIANVIEELKHSRPNDNDRLRLTSKKTDQVISTDPILLHMLLRNLLINALQHTRNNVDIEIFSGGIRIRDYGAGLPESIAEKFKKQTSIHREGEVKKLQDSHFGLLIVQLICERLGWHLNVSTIETSGTEIEILFTR